LRGVANEFELESLEQPDNDDLHLQVCEVEAQTAVHPAAEADQIVYAAGVFQVPIGAEAIGMGKDLGEPV
jgi:hypothetical protein